MWRSREGFREVVEIFGEARGRFAKALFYSSLEGCLLGVILRFLVTNVQ